MTIDIMPGDAAYDELNTLPMVLYDNVFTRGTLTTNTETDDGWVANAADAQTHDFWAPAILPAFVNTVLPQPETVDCLFVANHNIGSLGADIILRQDNLNIRIFKPLDNRPFMMVIPEVTATIFEFRIRNTATEPGTAYAGVVMLGKRLVFPSGVTVGYQPLNTARRVRKLSSTTLKGHNIGTRIVKGGGETSALIQNMPAEFVDNDMFEFSKKYSNGDPFAWASGPSLFPDDLGLVQSQIGGSLGETQSIRGDLKDINIGMRGFT